MIETSENRATETVTIPEGYECRQIFELLEQKGICSKEKLEQAYPGIGIAGMYSPPFRAMSAQEDEEVVARINASGADFVWVGLGAPKQENWMADHQGRVNGFMVGVGAGFDYFAGNIERAPEWMQKSNLEWLYRLLQDPKRLFKRYLRTNTKFIIQALILKK